MRLEVSLPDGRERWFLEPEEERLTLDEIALRRGHPLNTRCGGKGTCRGCTIRLENGEEVRACATEPRDGLAFAIPPRSLLRLVPRVVEHYRVLIPTGFEPWCAAGIGVAVDLGTTTVVAEAFDSSSGERLGAASAPNAQAGLGDDVVTRIALCASDPAAVGRLQRLAVEETLRPLFAQLSPEPPAAYVVAGNTVMLHLLLGENPASLGVAPFTPVFLEREPQSARALGLADSEAPVVVLPGASAYFGADAVVGLLATGAAYREEPTLFVDFGTNGEIALCASGRIRACATAAGPAFEGSGLSSGSRAIPGAVERLRLAGGEWAISTVADAPPAGICGTGYVDFLAEARRAGLVDEIGRIAKAAERPVGREGTRISVGPLAVTEADIARLLQAKAAIAAGVTVLLRRSSLRPDDVQTVFLAGGFGLHLDRDNAVAIGLLPGFPAERVEPVGNTSLGGAAAILLDRTLYEETQRIARDVEFVELNSDPGFEEAFLDALTLP